MSSISEITFAATVKSFSYWPFLEVFSGPVLPRFIINCFASSLSMTFISNDDFQPTKAKGRFSDNLL